MWDISVSSGTLVKELGVETAYDLIREAGFTAVDWNLTGGASVDALKAGDFENAHCLFSHPDDEGQRRYERYEKEYEAILAHGLTVGQAHAPYPSHPYVGEPDPKALEHTVPMMVNCLRFCHRMKVPNLVIHGVKGPNVPPEIGAELNRRLYAELLPVALEGDTVVCLENMFKYREDPDGTKHPLPSIYADAGEAVATLDELNRQAGREIFGFCVDTGHLNMAKTDIAAFIRTVGKRIKVLHIHDNNGKTDQHRAPYTGTIPWKEFAPALKDAGYTGNLNFETMRQTSLKTVDREMVLPWLKLIYACGTHFKRELEG